MENKQKPIVIKKIHRLETNKITRIIILFVILILGLEVFCFCYSCDKIKSIDSSVEKSLTKPTTPNNENEISYYRELSNKTDVAIDRIIVIVALFTGLLSLVGLILAFRVPLVIEKKMEEIEKKVNEAKSTADEVKLQSAITSSNTSLYNNTSSVSRGRTRVKILSKIIRKTPNNPLVYTARAKVYVQLGRTCRGSGNTTKSSVNYYNLALADYSLAMILGADVGECNNNMGVIYRELGDMKNALICYNKAISVDAKNNTFFINRGICYGILGKYEDALNDFETAIELDDEELSAYYERSIIYKNMYTNEKDETKKKDYLDSEYEDLKRATGIDPNYLPAKDRLVEVEKLRKSGEEKQS